jgi:hypothetical protein
MIGNDPAAPGTGFTRVSILPSIIIFMKLTTR